MSSVKLYVYDLSRGMARQMSLQLTGRQIDGIWHTSVVVFGKEVFYGQGICTTPPGKSHHGQPLQVVDMGETMIDEETFNDYIQEMRQVYTAEKYHLLDFNCNSFTNDCVAFLTGGSIPSWIKDLPADFLSTPFGAALRPTIDAMFSRPTPDAVSPPVLSDDQAASELVQAVASRATAPLGGYPTPAPTPHPLTASETVAAPIQICSNPQSFRSLLGTHRALVAFFTSQSCPPCRMIEPVFESIAHEKASKGIAFVKIDLGGYGGGSQIASLYGVRVTPTFIFFLDGGKIHEMKGADAPEFKTQVDLLLFQAFPPHPHTSKPLPTIRAISTDPILYSQVPNFQAVLSKAQSFIQAAPATNLSDSDKSNAKRVLSDTVIPLLVTKFDKSKSGGATDQMSAEVVRNACARWSETTTMLVEGGGLSEAELFPIVDLWRLALLDYVVSSWCAGQSVINATNPVVLLLWRGVTALSASSGGISNVPKALLLTLLRMLSNAFANVALARTIIDPIVHAPSTSSTRQALTTLLVQCLLHDDITVRTAAASVTFNVAAHYQKQRVEAQRSRRPGQGDSTGDDATSEDDADWEVEMVSAVLEALGRETNEDVVHRLAASLALYVHLSPFYEAQVRPLLEVLQAKEMLEAKISGNETVISKKDVRKLVQEIADQLC